MILPWVNQIIWDVEKNLDDKLNYKNVVHSFSYMKSHKERLLASHFIHAEKKECTWQLILSNECKLKLSYSDDYF